MFKRLSDRAQRCQNCLHWCQTSNAEVEDIARAMATALRGQVRQSRLDNPREHDGVPHRPFPGGDNPQFDMLAGMTASQMMGRCDFGSPPPEWPSNRVWGGYQHGAFMCTRWTGKVRPDERGTELPGEAQERLEPRSAPEPLDGLRLSEPESDEVEKTEPNGSPALSRPLKFHGNLVIPGDSEHGDLVLLRRNVGPVEGCTKKQPEPEPESESKQEPEPA